MTFILLTGAGFSYNWGGLLASEAFEYLIGAPEVTEAVKHQLWVDKQNRRGFEDTLAHFQAQYNQNKTAETERELKAIEGAVVGMFNAMNRSLFRAKFEPQDDMRYMVRTFLHNFDAIFTLNQDLLVERHYVDGNIQLSARQRWNGIAIPGIKKIGSSPIVNPAEEHTGLYMPDPANFKLSASIQPIIKLHGSSNWRSEDGQGVLIMGGNKGQLIGKHPILEWYFKVFKECLARPGAKLMVIGYSFGDDHINQTIFEAVEKHGLKIFIIDPMGVDVLNRDQPANGIRFENELQARLNSSLIGASRRPFLKTFGSDPVEFDKVAKFFR